MATGTYDNVTDRQDVDFFYEHAGYSYPTGANAEVQRDHRLAGAINLARAEADARHRGWSYNWELEPNQADCGCEDATDHQSFYVLLYDADSNVIGSLGAVCAPSRQYRRVVEAELALEAI